MSELEMSFSAPLLIIIIRLMNVQEKPDISSKYRGKKKFAWHNFSLDV